MPTLTPSSTSFHRAPKDHKAGTPGRPCGGRGGRPHGADLTEEHWDAFYAFYMDTGSRKWGRPYLNRAFFSHLGQRMADRVLLLMARRQGRWVAGALNLIGDDCLYGRNWGCLEDIPFLHFELRYYQAIEWAIGRGLARVEAGAAGTAQDRPGLSASCRAFGALYRRPLAEGARRGLRAAGASRG